MFDGSGLAFSEAGFRAIAYYAVGSNRLGEAKSFYDALLGSAGITPMFEHPSGGRVYGKDGSHCFVVLGAFDGKTATVGNGLHGLTSRYAPKISALSQLPIGKGPILGR
jgi:hypothetical protein